MGVFLLFGVAALLLLGLVALLWRLWNEYTQVSPEDEAFERSMVSLNDAQANRISDQQLRRPIDTDRGWEIMVQRGLQRPRRRPRQRPRRP